MPQWIITEPQATLHDDKKASDFSLSIWRESTVRVNLRSWLMTGLLMADSLRHSGQSRRRQNKGIDIDILYPSKTIPKAYTSERTELFILGYLFWLLYTQCTSTFVICYNRPYSAQECVGVCLFIPCMFITFRLFRGKIQVCKVSSLTLTEWSTQTRWFVWITSSGAPCIINSFLAKILGNFALTNLRFLKSFQVFLI